MNELKQRWQALREANPGVRIRDAALQLSVSEAALLETRTGEGVARLAPGIDRLCAALPGLGTVMSLVRNVAAVHEKDIAFPTASLRDGHIHFVGEEFSLSLDPQTVAHAFYVEDANPKGALRSIQLFDAAGTALWKIYARDKADHRAFERLLTDLAWPDGVAAMSFGRAPVSTGSPDAGSIRLQAFLEAIATNALPVCLDVANHGVRQSHRSVLVRIVRMGPWLNVLDPGFDWHLNESVLAGAMVDTGESPSLTLWLGDGSEASRLSLTDQATSEDRRRWLGLLERACEPGMDGKQVPA